MIFQIAPIISYLKFLPIDDTNIFATSSNLKTLEALMNSELDKVKERCDVNKLSINISKTSYIIIKSARKKDFSPTIQIKNNDGTYKKLIKKDHIKYLGIMLDDTISWRYHTPYIPYICSRISRAWHWHFIQTATLSLYQAIITNLL
jgi:hypothetical protein